MGTSRKNGSLFTNIVNGVAHVEFGHPAGNSFVAEMLTRLTAELEALSSNPEVSLILLKSEGDGAFCGGASFDELLAIETLEQGKSFFSGFANVINAMRTNSKIVVGRVQGKAVGGGVGLVAACDYVIATEKASVRLSEISIGIAPLVIAPAVERKVGKDGLAELSLDPLSWKNAYWARDKGLYAKVVDNNKELDREVEILTERLAAYNPAALLAMKSVLWEGTSGWEDLLEKRAEMSGKLALTPETKTILGKLKK